MDIEKLVVCTPTYKATFTYWRTAKRYNIHVRFVAPCIGFSPCYGAIEIVVFIIIIIIIIITPTPRKLIGFTRISQTVLANSGVGCAVHPSTPRCQRACQQVRLLDALQSNNDNDIDDDDDDDNKKKKKSAGIRPISP